MWHVLTSGSSPCSFRSTNTRDKSPLLKESAYSILPIAINYLSRQTQEQEQVLAAKMVNKLLLGVFASVGLISTSVAAPYGNATTYGYADIICSGEPLSASWATEIEGALASKSSLLGTNPRLPGSEFETLPFTIQTHLNMCKLSASRLASCFLSHLFSLWITFLYFNTGSIHGLGLSQAISHTKRC